MSNISSDLKGKKLVIDVNSSSIVDLKAELFRKQEQVREKKKTNTIDDESKIINDNNLYSQTLKNSKILPKRLLETVQQLDNENKIKKFKPSSNQEKTSEQNNEDENENEEQALKLSRMNLERKAKLYEQMSNGSIPIDDDDENILVNFQKKHSTSNYESDDDDDSSREKDLIEYVDQFGRTRMVSLKEYEQLENDRKKQQEDDYKKKTDSDSDDSSKIEDSQPKMPTLSNIHYEHVREGEVRDHGVGFFSFSGDEQIRAKQMEMLDQLRKQTETMKNEKQRIKDKRKQMLRSRLEKIAARKGITLPEEKDSDEDDDSNEDHIKMERATLNPDLYKPKINGPREWDLGKEGVEDQHYYSTDSKPKQSPFYSQNKYQDRLRQERNPEFAPPSSYSRNDRKSNDFTSTPQNKNNDKESFIFRKIKEIRKKS